MTAREFLEEEGIKQARFDIRNVEHLCELMNKFNGIRLHEEVAEVVGKMKAEQYNKEIDRNYAAVEAIENWWPKGNGTVDMITVNLNDDIRTDLPDPQRDDDDYSQVVGFAGGPFSYIATTGQQLRLMDAIVKVCTRHDYTEQVINYLNKLPV